MKKRKTKELKQFKKNFIEQIPKDFAKKIPLISSGVRAFEKTQKEIKEAKRDKKLNAIHYGVKELLDKKRLIKNKKISRSERTVLRELNILSDKIWFDRHSMLKGNVDSGKMYVDPEIWKGALKAEKDMVKRYGKKNLGPWTDFEWGMLNGKLSTLRWLFGEKWGTLDT